MKQNFFTRLIIAVALFGLTHTVNAQLKGTPWRAQWDSCIRGTPAYISYTFPPPSVPVYHPSHYLPFTPGGPYSYRYGCGTSYDTSGYAPTPLRIYENCPVHIDTAFYVPAGIGREVIFKDMPKDHEGKHYFVNKETGKVFPEFEPIKLDDSTEPTPFAMTFEHYPLSAGETVLKDGYEGAIIAEIKINGTVVRTETIKYQYFEHPKPVTFEYWKPAPKDPGRFLLKWSGELLDPDYRVGYDPKDTICTAAKARDLSNFRQYTAGAYYSFDDGATWIEATPDGIELTTAEIQELPDEFNVLMRLPYGCQSFIIASSDPDSPYGPRRRPGPMPRPDIVRQITMDNQTGAVLEPLKQIYDVNSGNDFELTVRPTGNNIPVLETSRNNRIPDSVGVVREERPDGSYHFTIRKVKENLTVTLKYTVGNAEVDGTRVWGEAGTLCIASATTGRASVYNALGRLCRTLNLSAGETRRLSLPVGVYIVTMGNGRAYKAAVN